MQSEKNKQILALLIKLHESASVTVLMKLSYLIDLIGFKKNNKQISEFVYKRYYFGPFDNSIYAVLSELADSGTIATSTKYSPGGDEYVIYSFNESSDFSFDILTDEERLIIEDTVEQLKGYGAKTLTEITYKTAPMKKLNATQGGHENLNTVLDLSCNEP